MFDYIERFYNPVRRHSTLGYVSPSRFVGPPHIVTTGQSRDSRFSSRILKTSKAMSAMPSSSLRPLGNQQAQVQLGKTSARLAVRVDGDD